MSLDANALVTLASFKSYLEVDGNSWDERFENMINWISAEVESLCNRHFISQSYVHYLDGDGSDTLILPQYPLVSVASIYDDTERAYTADTLIDPTYYMTEDDEGIVRLEGDLIFNHSKKNIKISYTAGYATVPYDIQHAVLDWATTIYKKIKDKTHRLTSIGLGDKQTNYDTSAIPAEVEKRLKPYRNRGYGYRYGN